VTTPCYSPIDWSASVTHANAKAEQLYNRAAAVIKPITLPIVAGSGKRDPSWYHFGAKV
jgi:hypothetical protein